MVCAVPETKPRIAYDSVLAAATLTASPATTEDDGAVTNCRDWLPWSFWRPTGSAPWTLEADLGGTFTVNAAAFAGHDLDDTVGVDRWNGAAWVEVATTEAIGDGSVIYLTWTAVATTKLRFRFDSLSFLAILWAGQDFTLPEGLAPGWSDPVLAQRAKTTHEASRYQVWLGTVVETWDARLTLSIKDVEPSWVRATWLPFLRACSVRPFFLHWYEDAYPNSACLCTQAEFGGTDFSGIGFCSASVSFNVDTGYDRRNAP